MGVLGTIGRRARDAAGWFTHPLLPDDLLGTLNPVWSTREPHARVVGVRRETPDTTTLVMRTRRGWPAHRAGEFVAVGAGVDGVWHCRTYSVTSCPGDPLLAITVTAIPGGVVSPRWCTAPRSARCCGSGRPTASFVLPERVPARLLFITAGSGITPVMGILRDLAGTRRAPDGGRRPLRPNARRLDVRPELRELASVDRLRLEEHHTASDGRLSPRIVDSSRTGRAAGVGVRPRRSARRAPEGCGTAGDSEALHVERFRPRRDRGGGRDRRTRHVHPQRRRGRRAPARR